MRRMMSGHGSEVKKTLSFAEVVKGNGHGGDYDGINGGDGSCGDAEGHPSVSREWNYSGVNTRGHAPKTLEMNGGLNRKENVSKVLGGYA